MQINKDIHIMTRFELILSNQSLLKTMVQNSITTKEVKYVDLMLDYKKMRSKQHKVLYIVNYLSQKYNIDTRTVYSVVKKMSSRVKV